MNWAWNKDSKSVLTDNATKAENRLKAIKKVSVGFDRESDRIGLGPIFHYIPV